MKESSRRISGGEYGDQVVRFCYVPIDSSRVVAVRDRLSYEIVSRTDEIFVSTRSSLLESQTYRDCEILQTQKRCMFIDRLFEVTSILIQTLRNRFRTA
jgi:hypothetical protein